jgi:hypothetical protein
MLSNAEAHFTLGYVNGFQIKREKSERLVSSEANYAGQEQKNLAGNQRLDDEEAGDAS